eukprot:NODE_2692_length_2165_cov_5.444063.p1 GENE.NODE_2692_length_2165_cov_5.444063~~NODE_2692_length_2165_cov_5.444063.p1  ORF type:complete len:600 (+),score=178.25 NODE_2692_length_2165_cov_5.444063:71-1870(+)
MGVQIRRLVASPAMAVVHAGTRVRSGPQPGNWPGWDDQDGHCAPAPRVAPALQRVEAHDVHLRGSQSYLYPVEHPPPDFFGVDDGVDAYGDAGDGVDGYGDAPCYTLGYGPSAYQDGPPAYPGSDCEEVYDSAPYYGGEHVAHATVVAAAAAAAAAAGAPEVDGIRQGWPEGLPKQNDILYSDGGEELMLDYLLEAHTPLSRRIDEFSDPESHNIRTSVMAYAQWLAEMKRESANARHDQNMELASIRGAVEAATGELQEHKHYSSEVMEQVQHSVAEISTRASNALVEVQRLAQHVLEGEQRLAAGGPQAEWREQVAQQVDKLGAELRQAEMRLAATDVEAGNTRKELEGGMSQVSVRLSDMDRAIAAVRGDVNGFHKALLAAEDSWKASQDHIRKTLNMLTQDMLDFQTHSGLVTNKFQSDVNRLEELQRDGQERLDRVVEQTPGLDACIRGIHSGLNAAMNEMVLLTSAAVPTATNLPPAVGLPSPPHLESFNSALCLGPAGAGSMRALPPASALVPPMARSLLQPDLQVLSTAPAPAMRGTTGRAPEEPPVGSGVTAATATLHSARGGGQSSSSQASFQGPRRSRCAQQSRARER